MRKKDGSYPAHQAGRAARLKEDPPALRTKHLVIREETYAKRKLGSYQIVRTEAFEWLRQAKRSSVHAVVTDPPYGLIEYSDPELQKMKNGHGGICAFLPHSMAVNASLCRVSRS